MIQHCPSCRKEYRSANKITIFGCCSHKTRKIVDGYLVKIEKPPETPYQPPPPKPDTSNEPGSVLYRIIRDTFSVKPKPGCGCYKLRDEMDALGVEGCQAEFGRLVDRLKENAKAYRWLELFGAALNAVRNGALGWLDPIRPWESILKHAIETSIELKAVTDAGKEIDKTSEGSR
jgi:hypothetical protein